MDARALLAIVLILWLIRTWVTWDVQVRKATLSRQQLRNRLHDSMLRVRVGARTGAPPAVVTTDAAPVGDGDPDSDSHDKRRLEQQLDMLEAQARATNQSDLELRRLRSELESVHSGRSSDSATIDALEARLNEQEAAIATNPEHSTGQSNEHQASQAISGDQQNTPIPDGADSDNAPDGKATKTPLFQAPAEKDDLKLIKGIGPVMERTLNELGVTTFKQLADFEQDDIDKVSAAIGAFSGRIERDDWVGKAQKFVREKSSV